MRVAVIGRFYVVLVSCGFAVIGRADDSEKLFVAEPLTKPGEFTPGIEGPAGDLEGNVFAVNFKEQGTIGKVKILKGGWAVDRECSSTY